MTTSSPIQPGALPPEEPARPVSLFNAFARVPQQPAPAEAESEGVSTAAAAAAILDATMTEDSAATGEQLAAAEQRAGILFDGASIDAAVSAARDQARTECEAELAELRKQLATMAGVHRQREAVLRLCEGRRSDDLLLVSAVATAAECGTTALDGFPMTLTWERGADIPEATDPVKRAIIKCTSSYGGRADLIVDGDDRMALASLLDTEMVVDTNAPCPHSAQCGTGEELDAAFDSELFGWARLEVVGIEGGPRWYCTPACVSNALARAGAELAVIDQMADDLVAVDQAEYPDAYYGPGASDEYALQVAEATEAAFDDERGDGGAL
ncbi:hypothetical protein ACFYQA_17455 [Streptomyces sp. NPDC005774]|uniref:hypothetical protein n=1 Tax=Streptomyces sp. NPDC005774 TaxID=3364728 RepID=UPI0036C7B6CE